MDILFNYLIGEKDKRGYKKIDTMNDIGVQLFQLLMSVACHRFEYEGLPKEIKPYNFERILNYFGQGILIKVNGQYAILQLTVASGLNIYNEPVKAQAIAMNGLNFGTYYINDYFEPKTGITKKQNAVWIRNNDTCTSTYFLLKPVIERLCFIWESMGINAGLSRVKAIIHANKDISGVIRDQITNIMGSRKAFSVVMDKNNSLDVIEKVDLGVEYEPEKYWADFDKTFYLACQLVGLTTNMANQKKERLVANEVEANDEITTIIQDTYLDHRRRALEECKEIFGLDIKVTDKYSKIKMTDATDKVVKNDPPSK